MITTNKSIFSQLKEVVESNGYCQGFPNDFYVHDLNAIEKYSKGDKAFWFPSVHYGSHFWPIEGFGEKNKTSELIKFNLIRESAWKVAYLVTFTDDKGNGTVEKISMKKSVELAQEYERNHKPDRSWY